jgi:hypothetical protein
MIAPYFGPLKYGVCDDLRALEIARQGARAGGTDVPSTTLAYLDILEYQ